MPVVFYLDDQPEERCVLIRLADADRASGFVSYLHSSMKPESQEHVRVKSVYVNSNGKLTEDDMSLADFEKGVATK